MNLDPLEAEVLGWLLDDPETPKTLTGGVALEFGSSVSAESVRAALVRVVEAGLVQAYEFDQASGAYRPIDVSDLTLSSWFMATKAGRALG
jgi:hypothetical protein